MHPLTQAIDTTKKRITEAEVNAGRDPASVQLIAVSKTRPASAIRSAWSCGLRHFGESYVQEAVDKIVQLHDCPIVWHFIGPIQANKTRQIAQHFDWVHSVDRIKIAERLSEQRPAELAPLNICIQINISNESSKSGIGIEALQALAAAIVELPRIRLRGLMAIPAPSSDKNEQYQAFNAVAEVQQWLISQGFALDALSMGMSDDMEMAIKAGATHVRIGTAIFGHR